MFNNQYYRNIVGKRDWHFDDNECNEIGNTKGEKGVAQWVTHTRGDNINGGNIQWIQRKLVCPNCVKEHKEGFKTKDRKGNFCCENVPPGSSVCSDDDNDPNSGCERYRFVMGIDETALPAEMGLYKKFEVDKQGWPSGCPGLKDFNMGKIGGPGKKQMKYSLSWSRQGRHTADTGCPVTDLAPIFEEYADSSQKFVEHFVPALEKMLRNGVAHGDLTDNFESGTPKCFRPNMHSRKRFWNCVKN